MSDLFLKVKNSERVDVSKVPVYPVDEFRQHIINTVQQGGRVVALFGIPSKTTGAAVRVYGVVTGDNDCTVTVLAADSLGSYRALTPECAQAHWFERELHEQTGLVPEGHPWLKPVRQFPLAPGVTDYYRLDGDEVHEVAVGPVHAGVIEPGHFRFQCHGETVYHLEISLGYQHRGIEKALVGGPHPRTFAQIETIAGDTTVGHTLAHCQLIEALTNTEVSQRAHALRAIALELERLANHAGDLGALASDIGYLPTASFCGRLRGDFLNLTAMICGNRFGRGLVRPGGAAFDIDDKIVSALSERLKFLFHETESAVDLLWETPSVLSRFENTGGLSERMCLDLGLVGPAARASGVKVDVRKKFPLGAYVKGKMTISNWKTGDVFGRAYVRWLEMRHSIRFILSQLNALPAGKVKGDGAKHLADSFVVSLVEGWRGEICHVALTDREGRFAHYKVVDPSFHNWMGLAMALRGQQISDFPLCNKSFNLSYCGHDL